MEKQDQEQYEFETNVQELSTPKSKENEVKNFSDNSFQFCLDVVDLYTTSDRFISDFYASGIKYRKLDRSNKKILATSMLSLASNPHGPKEKKFPGYCNLRNSMKNGQIFVKLFAHNFETLKSPLRHLNF